MRKQPTREQKDAAKARREKFRAIVQRIAKMPDAERVALAGRLGVIATCEGHGLSLHNSCLLALQCPTATVVGGFQQWRKQGRCVRKGEHGHMIWVPINVQGPNSGALIGDTPQPQDVDGKVTNRHDGEPVRFLIGTVFDISQTEAFGESEVAA